MINCRTRFFFVVLLLAYLSAVRRWYSADVICFCCRLSEFQECGVLSARRESRLDFGDRLTTSPRDEQQNWTEVRRTDGRAVIVKYEQKKIHFRKIAILIVLSTGRRPIGDRVKACSYIGPH